MLMTMLSLGWVCADEAHAGARSKHDAARSTTEARQAHEAGEAAGPRPFAWWWWSWRYLERGATSVEATQVAAPHARASGPGHCVASVK